MIVSCVSETILLLQRKTIRKDAFDSVINVSETKLFFAIVINVSETKLFVEIITVVYETTLLLRNGIVC